MAFLRWGEYAKGSGQFAVGKETKEAFDAKNNYWFLLLHERSPIIRQARARFAKVSPLCGKGRRVQQAGHCGWPGNRLGMGSYPAMLRGTVIALPEVWTEES